MSRREILNLPADEFIYWQKFFEIYPFTFEREDARHAELISSLTYVLSMSAQGKYLKKPISIVSLIPDYLKERKPVSRAKSLEQQRREFQEFADKYKAATGK